MIVEQRSHVKAEVETLFEPSVNVVVSTPTVTFAVSALYERVVWWGDESSPRYVVTARGPVFTKNGKIHSTQVTFESWTDLSPPESLRPYLLGRDELLTRLAGTAASLVRRTT